MTTATTAPPMRFRTQRESDPDSVGAQLVRDGFWAVFSRFAEPGTEVEDFELAVTAIQASTGWAKGVVEQAILAHSRLQDLPQVRALQAEQRLLDMHHITAIDQAIAEAGPELTPEELSLFDDTLASLFTPTRRDQAMHARGAVTRRVRDLIKRVFPSRAFNPKRRKEREDELDTTGDSLNFDEIPAGGTIKARVSLTTDEVTSARIHAHVLEFARIRKIPFAEAAVKLLTGDISTLAPTPPAVVHVFSPKNREPGDPVFLPRFGWTGPEGTLAFEEWLKRADPKTVDLEAVEHHEIGGYVPSEAMKAFVRARDGSCIFPGCSTPASKCQLDHRIPYGDGGATTPWNLFSLCQKHHNVKTDKRAYYLPDPATGEVVWLFSDGSFETSTMDGVLYEHTTPTNPRWRSSLDQVRERRDRKAAFFAEGHTILDYFDRSLDLERTEEAIEHLEAEYGLDFPFTPLLPEPEPELIEPVEEPPYPDPLFEDEQPGEVNPFHVHPRPFVMKIRVKPNVYYYREAM